MLEGASGFPLHNADRTPIFFVPWGAETNCYALGRALQAAGFFASGSTFPAVVHGHSGVRFTVSLHNTFADIDALLEALTRLCRELSITAQPGTGPVASAE